MLFVSMLLLNKINIISNCYVKFTFDKIVIRVTFLHSIINHKKEKLNNMQSHY